MLLLLGTISVAMRFWHSSLIQDAEFSSHGSGTWAARGLGFVQSWAPHRHSGRSLRAHQRLQRFAEATSAKGNSTDPNGLPASGDLPGAEGDLPVETYGTVTAAAEEPSLAQMIPRSFIFQAGLYAVSVGLIYSVLTARDSPAYKDRVQRAIDGAVPKSGLRVLELGIGEAPNLQYYPSGTTLVGVDIDLPQPEFRRGVEVRAAQQGVRVYWARGSAEKLPFEPGTFDAVITTTVFCSVQDPAKALSEVSRVLKPGGKLAYVEHVAADDGSLLEQQQLFLDPFQQATADNCHLHRDTDSLIRSSVRGSAPEGAALFSKEDVAERYQVWQMWPIAQQAFGIVTK